MGWKDKDDPWEIEPVSWTGGTGSWDFSKTTADHFYNEGNLVSSSYNPVFPILDATGDPISDTHDPCGYWFNISNQAIIDRTDDDDEENPYGPKNPGSGGGGGDPPCDGVPELVIHEESSVEVLADNSSGLVGLSGVSGLPITVIVAGDGFYADMDNNTVAEYPANTNGFYVYTGNACGTCKVTVEDVCSTVDYYIRAADGEMQLFSESCIVSGEDEARYHGGNLNNEYFNRYNYWYQLRFFYSGRYYVTQVIGWQATNATGYSNWWCVNNMYPPYYKMCVEPAIDMDSCDSIWDIQVAESTAITPITIRLEAGGPPKVYIWVC